jgi:hypothetical protein
MVDNGPQEPACAPPGADVDPGYDLSTPEGYRLEVARMRIAALADGNHAIAHRYMELLGKMHGYFNDPEPEPELEHDLEVIRKLAIRLGVMREDGTAA